MLPRFSGSLLKTITLDFYFRSNILPSNKFTVLSPISDKSQEQSSEQGDSSSKTPKISPTEHILTSCCGMNPELDTENNNQEPAPFAMPKLQRKLMQKQYYQNYSAKNSIQGKILKL